MKPIATVCYVVAGLLLLAAALTIVRPYANLVGAENILQTELAIPFNRFFMLLMVAGAFAGLARYLQRR